MKTLVEYIVKALVDQPDQILIAERTGRNTMPSAPFSTPLVPVRRNGWYSRLWDNGFCSATMGLGFPLPLFLSRTRPRYNTYETVIFYYNITVSIS